MTKNTVMVAVKRAAASQLWHCWVLNLHVLSVSLDSPVIFHMPKDWGWQGARKEENKLLKNTDDRWRIFFLKHF